MEYSSTKPIIFHRFFSHDWKYGLFVLEDELSYTYFQVASPIFLTRMLLKCFKKQQSNPKEAFIEFFLWVLSEFDFEGETVSIPRFGEWACSEVSNKKNWGMKWESSKKEIFIEITSKRIAQPIKRTHENLKWDNKNGLLFLTTEENWEFADQLREGCPEEEDIENYFIARDISAIKRAIELWLLRQEITKVPVEEKVGLKRWLKGLQKGLKGKVSVDYNFSPPSNIFRLTQGVEIEGNMYKSKDGAVFQCSNEKQKSFFTSIHGEIKPFTKDDYLQTAAAWLGFRNKGELLAKNPKWVLLEKYEKLTPSQRVSIYSLPPKAWEGLEDDFWASEWERQASFIKVLQEEGEDISPNVNENLLNMICDYWKSKIKVDLTTPEKFMLTKRDNRIQRVPFWEAKDYPMGFAFSSPYILALVWSELLWCAAQNIEIQQCDFCQEFFVSKKASRFCSKKCNEDYLSTEESCRTTLKSLHQSLRRMSEKVRDGKVTIEKYLEQWEKWEIEKLKAKSKNRPAKKIHPGLVIFYTAEGKEIAKNLKLALAEKDDYAEAETWNDYINLLKKYNIPPPPKEWVKAFLKNLPLEQEFKQV